MFELILGGYLMHWKPQPKNVCYRCFRPQVGLRYVIERDKYSHGFTGLLGANSINKPIVGAFYNFQTKTDTFFDFGPIVGVYKQDDQKFRDLRVKPFSYGDGYVPVAGAELNFHVTQKVDMFMIATPIIGIAGFKFKY